MGQCASLIVSSATTTPASCPSSGGITVNATGTGLTFQIISGPSGYPPASNTTGIFNGLSAGAYTIEVRDACATFINVIRTVSNTYPTFGVSNVVTSNVCNSGTPGGTITGIVGGGKSPFQYDIVPVASSPVYGSNTTSTSYAKAVTTFGTYRFYAKDACGEVRTYDIDILPQQPTPVDLWWEDIEVNRPCAETMDGLPTVSWNLHILDQNGTGVDFNTLLGASYQIYKPSPANTIGNSAVNCNKALGSLLNSGTIVAGNIPVGEPQKYPIVIPQEDVILVFTNTCGQSFKYCYNFNNGNAVTPDANMQILQQSCSGTWSSQSVSINNNWVLNMTYPISFKLTKNGGATVTNSTGNFYSLVPSNFPATVLLTDACGRTLTKNFTMPIQGSALQGYAEPEWAFTCTNTKNTATAQIRMNGGDLPGLADATNVTISGGTVAAVPTISPFQSWLPGYYASNLLAGSTYIIRITNLCGEKDSLTFTVPNDHWTQPVLNWNLTATSNALCGQNKSTITANSGFTGSNVVTYYLYDLAAPNTVVASNTSGIFNNVTPADYKLKFMVPANSTLCPTLNIADSINVTVLADATGQSITRKTITNCESGGTALPTGKAIVEVNGSAPFTYEIIKTSLIGTGATEVWDLSSTGNPSNTYTWNLPLSGDPANTVYTYRSTDKCGNKVTTQGAMQPLNTPVLQTTASPCIGAPNYTLTITPYPGPFTYRWVKLPDLVSTLSTTNSLTFPGAYSNGNNGTYRCYVSLPGCVDRTKDVSINSAGCGGVLPVTLVSFTGTLSNSTASLKWLAENEINLNNYTIERSFNGFDFSTIQIKAASNLASNEYSYIDNAITNAVVYYRLKMTDRDGKVKYSTILKLTSATKNTGIEIYPHPAKSFISATFNASNSASGTMKIINSDGSIVYQKNIQITKGSNTFSINDIQSMPTGSYIIQVTYSGSSIRNKFLKL